MAQGDVVQEISSIAAGSYLDLQPSGTIEWVIHNIYHENDITVEYYDGSNSLVFQTEVGAGVIGFCNFHCTNGHRIRVKNAHASAAKLIGYDGIVTKA